MQLENDSGYQQGLTLYGAQHLRPAILNANFVIRLPEYRQIYKAISRSSMVNRKPHIIVQGVSGSGKTTLLKYLALQVADDSLLSQRLIPVSINEGEYAINSLFSLWQRVCEILDETHRGDFETLIENFDEITPPNPTQAFETISTQLAKVNKKIVLFVDNIGALLTSFSQQDRDHFRQLLTSKNNLHLIASATLDHRDACHDQHSFYYSFVPVSLGALTTKEITTLLIKLAEHQGIDAQEKLNTRLKNHATKIESLRRLTDGTPRSVVILFNSLMNSTQLDTLTLLDTSIDHATPLYKQTIANLSKQQKPIINAIALHWDAVAAKEIAQQTKLPSKQISAQLSQLEKQQLIVKIPTNTKNYLYALKDRFLNIWYLSSYGRQQEREKVNGLLRFFESWCSEVALKTDAMKITEQIEQGIDKQPSLLVAKALTNSNFLEPHNKQLIYSTMSKSLQQTREKKLFNTLLANNAKLSHSKKLTTPLFEQFFLVTKMGEESIKKLIRQLEQNRDQAKIAIIQLYDNNERRVKNAEQILTSQPSEFNHLMLGVFYFQHKRYHEALPLLLPYQEQNAAITALLATIYYRLNDYLHAEKLAREAIHLGNRDSYLELGFSLLAQQHFPASIAAFKQLLSMSVNSNNAATYCMLGITYKAMQDHEHGEENLLKSLRLSAHDKATYIELADLYMKQAKFQKVETCFYELIELGKFTHWDELIQLVIFKKELPSLESTVQTSLTANYVDAYNTAAWRCFENRFQAAKALYYSNKAISLTPNIETYHTNVAVALWNNHIELATNSMHHFLTHYGQEIDGNESAFIQLFILFLAKQQTQLVEKWLKEHQLCERFKPLYYALMSLMQDKYPNEILRMGGDLKETVDEILLEIETLAKQYK